jgi:hypothetical protein
MKWISLLGIGWWICAGCWMLTNEGAAQPLNNDLGVSIAWDPNPEPEVVGYKVYAGRASRTYDYVIDAGPETAMRVAPLESGVRFFFAVTAYNAAGLESPFSEEISYTLPIGGTNAFLLPLSLSAGVGSSPTIEFNAILGRTSLVQASSDLSAWETIQLFPPATIGAVTWNDETSRPYRFYRVISQIVPDDLLNGVLDGAGILP